MPPASDLHVQTNVHNDQTPAPVKQEVFSTDSRPKSDFLVPSLDDTEMTPDQANTNLKAPSVEHDTPETRKCASDLANLATDTASLPPKASFESMDTQGQTRAEPDSALPINRTEDPDFQPTAPTRSWTVNQQIFDQIVQVVTDTVRGQGGAEQPIIVNFGKIEIINGSVPRSDQLSPDGGVSVARTISNADKLAPGDVTRSDTQATQTMKTALEKFSSFYDWIIKLPRPKPFTVPRSAKNAHDQWQPLEVLLDTGSDSNLIPYSEVKALGLLDHVRAPDVPTVTGIGGGQVKIEGSIEISGKWNGRQDRQATFHVVDKGNEDITETVLGAESITTFQLLRIRVGRTNGHSVNPVKKVDKAAQENITKAEEDAEQNDKDKAAMREKLMKEEKKKKKEKRPAEKAGETSESE